MLKLNEKLNEKLKKKLKYSVFFIDEQKSKLKYISYRENNFGVAKFYLEIGCDNDYETITINLIWDEKTQSFERVGDCIEEGSKEKFNEKVRIELQSEENIIKIDKKLREIEDKIAETKSYFNDLGFDKPMLFLHNDTDIEDWYSSNC